MDYEPSWDEIRIMDHERDQRYYHERELEKKRRDGNGAVLSFNEKKVLWQWECTLCHSYNCMNKYAVTESILDTVYCTYCGTEQPLIEHKTVLDSRAALIQKRKDKEAAQKVEKQRLKELAELERLKAKYGDTQEASI